MSEDPSSSEQAAAAIDALGEAAEQARSAAGELLWSRAQLAHEDMYVAAS